MHYLLKVNLKFSTYQPSSQYKTKKNNDAMFFLFFS